MGEHDNLAAQALLQQLTYRAPTPPSPPPITTLAEPEAERCPADPGPLLADPAPSAYPVERSAPDPAPDQTPDQTNEAADSCTACGAALSASLDWCSRCLTPVRARPTAPPPPPPPPAGTNGTWAPPVAPAWTNGSWAPPAIDGYTSSNYQWPAQQRPEPTVARSAVFLALGVIALNFLVQFGTYAYERTNHVQPDTAITLGLWVGTAFYAAAVYLALRNRAAASVKPAWTVGSPKLAWFGVLVGGAACLLVLGLQKAVTHHAGDATAQLIVSNGSITRIAMAFVSLAVIAPAVEEFVFRAILAESLRSRGLIAATLISSLLFAAAHLRLNPANLLYYTLVGSMLATLYFKFGLKASVLAHATFNGLFTLVAVLSIVGPTKTFTVDGATLRLPAVWHTAPLPEGVRYQVGLEGPSASAILVLDQPIPAGTTFDLNQVRQKAQQNSIPFGATITSDQTASYPAGPALVINLTANGYPGELVIMSTSGHEWLFVLSTGGSSKAQSDFDHMLEHLTLP